MRQIQNMRNFDIENLETVDCKCQGGQHFTIDKFKGGRDVERIGCRQ